ncbi:homoserine kinase [Vagococcus elongatus]|uniref:Homoserine kinase n=1 Tax=Vagococcus elongatus TaxID=180344 RepID=A0A430B499_9ENTE|nr:homoserine kinase [Vagococcus elongatus]RSU15170.1 homoserine kinase [Vagococcus elongatus]
MKIHVPATTANLGPGFDSCGLALNLYLTLDIKEMSEEWAIEHEVPGIPKDKTNLIIETALSVAPDIKPHRLVMTTDIPSARGLGSSSSAVVAGIELANILGGLDLSVDDKLKIASKIEGHPDNVAPAILGGLVIASYVDDEIHHEAADFPEADLLLYIPKHELLTTESRNVLPETLPYKEAVQASAISNMLVASLLKGNLPLAGEMMMKDKWHEKYREALVPHLTEIKKLQAEFGFYGAVLSGAGPTVLILCPKDGSAELQQFLIDTYQDQAVTLKLTVDKGGARVED